MTNEERNDLLEEAYKQARGQNADDRFKKFGTNQMYWKGRSDAAQAVREMKTMSYHETVVALKDFRAADRRLDEAAEQWDYYRSLLCPQYDGERFSFTSLWVKPEVIGNAAQEFLSAYNAYKRLGERGAR